MATKKATGKSLVNWTEELAKRAKRAAGMEAGGEGNWIGLQGGIMKYQGAEIPKNEMDVVILYAVHENVYYGENFDPDDPKPPKCYAFADEGEELAPNVDQVEEPENDVCETCPLGGKEAWGTADKGDGKACKNTRRIALVPADQLDDISKAEVAYMRLPVTSVKAWKGYVRQLDATLNKPPFAVITRVSVVRDSKTQFKLQFELIEEIGDEHFEPLVAAVDRQATAIKFPYQKPSEHQPRTRKPQRGKSKPQTKAKTAPAKGAKFARR